MRNHCVRKLTAEILAREFADYAENTEVYRFDDLRGSTVKVTVEYIQRPVKVEDFAKKMEQVWNLNQTVPV